MDKHWQIAVWSIWMILSLLPLPADLDSIPFTMLILNKTFTKCFILPISWHLTICACCTFIGVVCDLPSSADQRAQFRELNSIPVLTPLCPPPPRIKPGSQHYCETTARNKIGRGGEQGLGKGAVTSTDTQALAITVTGQVCKLTPPGPEHRALLLSRLGQPEAQLCSSTSNVRAQGRAALDGGVENLGAEMRVVVDIWD